MIIILSLVLFCCSNSYTPSEKAKVCTDAFTTYSPENIKYDSLESYITKLTNKVISEAKNDSFFLSLALEGETENTSTLADKIGFYLFILIISFVPLLTIPVFCVCCCFSCCLFKKAYNPLKNKKNYIVSAILMGVMLIFSIIGFVYAYKFIEHFNGGICSFVKFFEHLAYGDEDKELPRWVGINMLSISIGSSLSKSLDKITENYNIAFNDHKTKVKEPTEQYKEKLDGMKSKYYKPITGTNIYPSFALQYKDKDDHAKFLGQLYTEFNNSIYIISQGLELLKDVCEKIDKEITPLRSELNKLQNSLAEIDALSKEMSDRLIDNFLTFQKFIDDIFLLIFKIVFGFFFAASGITTIILSIYTFTKFKFLRIFIHVIWNVLLVFIMFTLFISALFGIVEAFCKELIPVIGYILSTEYLTSDDSIFSNSEIFANSLDCCLNGNGNLAEVLGISGGNIGLIQDLYNSSIFIKGIEKEFENISDSEVANTIDKELNKIKNDFSLSTEPEEDYGDDSINSKLKSINDEIEKYCGSLSKQKDIFTINRDKCQSEFTYIESSTVSDECSKKCYNIEKLNPPISPYNTSISISISSISQIISEGQDQLTAIIRDNTALKENFKTIMANLKEEIKRVLNKVSDSIIGLLEPLVGNNGFFSMFNCKFLRYDLIMFVDQLLNNFINDCLIISVMCLLSSICVYIAVYFIIPAMYENLDTDNKNTKSDLSDNHNEIKVNEDVPITPLKIY